MKLLFTFLIMFSFTCFAQKTEKRGTIKIEKNTCLLLQGNDSVYSSVDKMPEFKGGQNSFNKWMNKNLVFPDLMASGTVFCSFVVKANGSITDIKILKSTYREFDLEANRLIQLMPPWNPGICNGAAVAVKVNYPIKFILK